MESGTTVQGAEGIPVPVPKMKGAWKKAVKVAQKYRDLDPLQLKMVDKAGLVKLTPNDILIASYPKSGGKYVGRVVQQVIMYMQKMMGNEVDEPGDIPLYEMVTEANRDHMGGIYTTNLRYEYIAKKAKGCKVIYVVKNPKHTAIELFNNSFARHMTFPEFVNLFMGETGTSSEDPYNYKIHFRQYLHNPATLDLMFLKLEDVETVSKKAIDQILEHLGASMQLSTDACKSIMAEVPFEEQTATSTWGEISKRIEKNDFNSFFDLDLLNTFDKVMKVDWRMVRSASV